MAAPFPPNFNDGEHCFPADLFFNPYLRQHQLQHHHLRRQHLPCIDDLAHYSTALSLLQRDQIPHTFELQIESYVKDKANRVLQRQQNRLLQQNRVLPYQGSGFSFNGDLLREHGGTGVFHPRINTYTTSHSTATVARKQSMGDRQKIQPTQQWNTMKRSAVVLSKQEEYHLPPDMGLPRDWTY